MSDPEFLQERNSQLELQVRNLQESVGRWKREAQGKPPRFEYVQQRHERGQHYISVPVESLPSDTPLHEAQEYIRDHVLPKFYPYKYYNCYSSRRYSGWVVTMVREDRDVDMDAGPA
ncbi:hypothetical protein [Paenibacillus agricola]|uniref:Uncharacterized protein n=1 Tax=Paenibacillus agricola TaxID=2716264 RepID=A0ABX0JBN0_9BACL|nr:hypothetical protein [Paenibacillus agricola]NHN33557.1 hypothetical protein [Paenibacillus agricola]